MITGIKCHTFLRGEKIMDMFLTNNETNTLVACFQLHCDCIYFSLGLNHIHSSITIVKEHYGPLTTIMKGTKLLNIITKRKSYKQTSYLISKK